MNTDLLFFGVVIAGFLYFAGSRALAAFVGIGVAFIFILGQFEPKPKKAKAPNNVLEPIIIESTRGAPYKIPENINLWVKPKSYPEQWWKKGVRKGLPGTFAKATVWKLYDSLHRD
jgi:hypothetical protein